MIIINVMLFTWSFAIFADLGLWTISVQFHMKDDANGFVTNYYLLDLNLFRENSEHSSIKLCI